MEGMNNEITRMIMDLQMMHYRQQNAADQYMAENDGKDRYGFPFEPSDSFSTEPLGFSETAMRLQVEAQEIHRFASEYNRHSPQYYQMASQLEKLLGQLGSLCITKAVIEQREGKPFTTLNSLTIDWLRKKTAFHFRKCYESFMESAEVLSYNANALNLSIRWAVLDRRLQATAEKIEAIKAGKVKVDLSDKAEAVKKQAYPTGETAAEQEKAAPLSPKGTAFPVDKAAVRAAGGQPVSAPAAEAEPAADHAETPAPMGPEEIPEAEEAESLEEVLSDFTDDELLDFIREEELYHDVSDELISQMWEYYKSRQYAAAQSPP